jgi:ketosteroid isomerase-like protein
MIVPTIAVAAIAMAQVAEPGAAASAFLDAFRQMDEARFDPFFAPDVTMFFPDGAFPTSRVEGRDAVLAVFHGLFARARRSGRTRLAIAPIGERIQSFGDIAIVTFGLDSEDSVGRRTIVLRNVSGEWRIVHFHASTADR